MSESCRVLLFSNYPVLLYNHALDLDHVFWDTDHGLLTKLLNGA